MGLLQSLSAGTLFFLLRSTEYSILHRNERFMKKAVILYVLLDFIYTYPTVFPNAGTAISIPIPVSAAYRMPMWRLLCGSLTALRREAPAAGHPLFWRRHPQSAAPGAGKTAHRCGPADAGAEITLEANPETVTEQSLAGFREAGVNRISFGVQSARDTQLRTLGRPAHGKAGAGCLCRRPAGRLCEHQRRHHAGTAALHRSRV